MVRRVISIVIAVILLMPVFLTGQTYAQTPMVEIEILDHPSLVFQGDQVAVDVRVSNVTDSLMNAVELRASSGESRAIGTIIPKIDVEITLFLTNYHLGTNFVNIYAVYSGGQSTERSIRFEVRAPEESITLRIIDAPPTIYKGMVYTAHLEVQNLRQEAVTGARIKSNNKVVYYIGSLNPNESRRIDLRIEDYTLGSNHLELTADHEWGTTAPVILDFEVRPQQESIALRLIEAPQSIYEGITYTALIEVHNVQQAAISRTSIKNGNDVLYEVGRLNANESREIRLQLDNYEIGVNRLHLTAEYEHGTAGSLDLDFRVVPASSAVKVYLSSSNSPVYVSETIELSLVVASSEDAEIKELEVKALNDNVQPSGYYLGEYVAEQQDIEIPDLGSLLTGSQSTTDEESQQRSVRGRELQFDIADLNVGTQPMRFQITYRLGSAVIEQQFDVDVTILATSSVKLIQAEKVVAHPDEDTLVTLHVANGLPVTIDSVTVVPLGNSNASPSEFFIGQMAPDDFLPAYFKYTEGDLNDGDELSFMVVYRVGRQIYETPQTVITVNVEEDQGSIPYLQIIPPVAIVFLVLIFWFLRRRRKLFSATNLIVFALLLQFLWFQQRGPWIQ